MKNGAIWPQRQYLSEIRQNKRGFAIVLDAKPHWNVYLGDVLVEEIG